MASTESKLIDIARSGRLVHPMTRRSFISLLGSAGILTGAAACGLRVDSENGNGAADPSESTANNGEPDLVRGRIHNQVTTLGNDFFVAFDEGAQQFSAALGLTLATVEDDANVNQAIGQVGNVATAGDQMMFGTPATEAQAQAVIEAAQEQGVYYGSAYTAPSFVTPADFDRWVRFITPPEVVVAKEIATALFEEVGGEGVIVHVPGAPGSSADDARTRGFEQALAGFPDIEVVTTSPGNWIAEDARVAFSNALPSIPDFVGVFAQNDSQASGVISALDAQDISGIAVTGFDGNERNIELIAEGKQLLTSATIGGLTAALIGVAVFDAVNGVEFSLPERYLHQGAVLVTSDFASEFADNIYQDELPFDWERMSRVLHPDDWDPQTLLRPIDPFEFFADADGDLDDIHSDWDAVRDDLPAVAQNLRDRFQTGPLADWKDSMVV